MKAIHELCVNTFRQALITQTSNPAAINMGYNFFYVSLLTTNIGTTLRNLVASLHNLDITAFFLTLSREQFR